MKENGFTFIEVIIAIAVIMILSTVSISYYGNFREQKKLENNAQALIETLELAKKKAVAADKSSLSSGGTDYSTCDLTGFQVVISSTTDYALSARVCDNVGSCPLASGCVDIPLQSYKTTAPIILSPLGSAIFNTATRDETGLSSITLTHQNLNTTRLITIAASGVIE